MSHALCIMAGAAFTFFAVGRHLGNTPETSAFSFVVAVGCFIVAAVLEVAVKGGAA